LIRTPVKRKSIKLPMDVKSYLKLQEMQLLTKDDDILNVSKHYDMLARKALGKSGYSSLYINKDPRKHTNWKYFEYVYELCKIKEWDVNLYLEAQFKYYKQIGKVMPYPNMICSDNAIRGYARFLMDIREKHRRDIGKAKRERGKETQTIREEVIEGVIHSVETLDTYIRANTTYTDKAEYKAMRIYQAWQELSPYYLWSIPWFHSIIGGMTGSIAEKYIAVFEVITKSPTIQSIISETVSEVERSYNIPHNLQL
jgi:hypothetical protein